MTAEFTAPHIHCQKCAQRVRDALTTHAGIKAIDIDPPTHRVKIEFDEAKTSRDGLKNALAGAGYPPTE